MRVRIEVGWCLNKERSKQGGNWVGKKANIDSDTFAFVPTPLSHTIPATPGLPYPIPTLIIPSYDTQIKTLIPSTYSVPLLSLYIDTSLTISSLLINIVTYILLYYIRT